MSFDGVFTHAMVNELRETLLSGRISKIHQPYENEIILVIACYCPRILVMHACKSHKSTIKIPTIRLILS